MRAEERIKEREWTDAIGDHFEVRAQGRSGRIYSRKVTRTALGWPLTWDQVRAEVHRAVVKD
jgi:hypothetical protein